MENRVKILMITVVPSLAAPVARNLDNAGYGVCMISKERLIGARFFPFVSRYAAVDKGYFDNPQKAPAFANLINRLARTWKIDIVLPIEIASSVLVHRLRSGLEIPAVPLFDADQRFRFNNKWHFYCFLKEHGIPTPKTVCIDDTTSDPMWISLPLLLKPLDKAAGIGIMKMGSRAELDDVLRLKSEERPFILQKYIPGVDYSVGLLADGGELRAWIINKFDQAPPHRHFVTDEDVCELARAVVRAMVYTGVAVMDIRRDNDGRLYVIEINQRFGGSDIYYGKAGVNLGARWIEMALNREATGTVFRPVREATIRLSVCDRIVHRLGGPIPESVSSLCSATSKRLFNLKPEMIR